MNSSDIYNLIKNKRLFFILAFLLILSDLLYSFLQFYYTPLDGDMAGGIIPSPDVLPVLNDPLGLNALLENKYYPNPNRFFSHYFFKHYFSYVPFFLQNYFNEIDSVYIACATAKFLIHLTLISIIVKASSIYCFSKKNLIIAFILAFPLFQTHGYQSYMGIIDQSVTYCFFYSFPLIFLALFFIPFLKSYFKTNYILSKSYFVFILLLIPIVSLSGPLNPGIVLVVSFIFFCRLIYLKLFHKGINFSIDSKLKIAIVILTIFSAYSIYLGTHNSINSFNTKPIIEIYKSLPAGFFYQLFSKLGFPILLFSLVINFFLLKNYVYWKGRDTILNFFKWIFIFCIVYIIVLPFGGYRNYRPNVLRYDTILPITFALFFLFTQSSLFVISNIDSSKLKIYSTFLSFILLVFMLADKPEFEKNYCEKHTLYEIANSKNYVVKLSNNCTVLSWNKIHNTKESELNSQLLLFWKITKTKKLYYQQNQ